MKHKAIHETISAIRLLQHTSSDKSMTALATTLADASQNLLLEFEALKCQLNRIISDEEIESDRIPIDDPKTDKEIAEYDPHVIDELQRRVNTIGVLLYPPYGLMSQMSEAFKRLDSMEKSSEKSHARSLSKLIRVPEAYDTMRKALSEDSDYRDSWLSNIACCLMDAQGDGEPLNLKNRAVRDLLADLIMDHCFPLNARNTGNTPVDKVNDAYNVPNSIKAVMHLIPKLRDVENSDGEMSIEEEILEAYAKCSNNDLATVGIVRC